MTFRSSSSLNTSTDSYYKPFELYTMVKLAGLHPEIPVALSVALGSRIARDLFFAVDQNSLIISWLEEPAEVKAKYTELAKRMRRIIRGNNDVVNCLRGIEEEEETLKQGKQEGKDGSDNKASGASSSSPDVLQKQLDALLGVLSSSCDGGQNARR